MGAKTESCPTCNDLDPLCLLVSCAERRKVQDALVKASCETCQHIKQEGGYGPPHFASERCESGRRDHCSCDTCF